MKNLIQLHDFIRKMETLHPECKEYIFQILQELNKDLKIIFEAFLYAPTAEELTWLNERVEQEIESAERRIKEEIEENSFVAQGSYCYANAGGYLVQIHPSGDSARVKDGEKISDWLEIEYIFNPDLEEEDQHEPVIDPFPLDYDGIKPHFNIPLNQVMRVNF